MTGLPDSPLYFLTQINLFIGHSRLLMKKHPDLSKLLQGSKIEKVQGMMEYDRQLKEMSDDDYAKEVDTLSQCFASMSVRTIIDGKSAISEQFTQWHQKSSPRRA